jgi:hypothetical protein
MWLQLSVSTSAEHAGWCVQQSLCDSSMQLQNCSALCCAEHLCSCRTLMLGDVYSRASVQLQDPPVFWLVCNSLRQVGLQAVGRYHGSVRRWGAAAIAQCNHSHAFACVCCLRCCFDCAGTRAPAVAPNTAVGAVTQFTRRRAASSSWHEQPAPQFDAFPTSYLYIFSTSRPCSLSFARTSGQQLRLCGGSASACAPETVAMAAAVLCRFTCLMCTAC